MSETRPGDGFDRLTIRPFSVMMISVLMVWRFFLPEYQQRCLRLGRWIGCSVQSIIKASASSRLTLIRRVTPRTLAAKRSIRRKERLIAA